eukprot:11675628-Heterocapsa_arctica.AAC.1
MATPTAHNPDTPMPGWISVIREAGRDSELPPGLAPAHNQPQCKAGHATPYKGSARPRHKDQPGAKETAPL